jgi:hypothetical protein
MDDLLTGVPLRSTSSVPPPLRCMLDNIEQFTDEFVAYLPDNLHVYSAFEREAYKVLHKGFAHYSARTIIEWLRHASAGQVGGAWS